jgi:transposase
MQSLTRTCKFNGINPQAYLKYVLTNIADHKMSRLDELLP